MIKLDDVNLKGSDRHSGPGCGLQTAMFCGNASKQ